MGVEPANRTELVEGAGPGSWTEPAEIKELRCWAEPSEMKPGNWTEPAEEEGPGRLRRAGTKVKQTISKTARVDNQ